METTKQKHRYTKDEGETDHSTIENHQFTKVGNNRGKGK